jgi:glycosyltransferase involved in cell wall biosynthesis
MDTPLVSIGLPVFNGENSLPATLESLLSQTFTDFELIISDNCSTDNTNEICHMYLKNDPRMRYTRQHENLGPAANFEWVLRHSSGRYFMWAAADDCRSENFLEDCVRILNKSPSCVAATSYDKFTTRDYVNTFELKGSTSERLLAFLEIASDSNALFYSLMRKEVVEVFDFRLLNCLAADWLVICHLARHGEVLRTPHALTLFAAGGFSHSTQRYSFFRSRKIHWVYPLYSFSSYITSITEHEAAEAKNAINRKLSHLNRHLAFDQVKLEYQLTRTGSVKRFMLSILQKMLNIKHLRKLVYNPLVLSLLIAKTPV